MIFRFVSITALTATCATNVQQGIGQNANGSERTLEIRFKTAAYRTTMNLPSNVNGTSVSPSYPLAR